ncbi:MAG: LysM repeat protein [Bacteroidia bacterium]
MQITLKNKIVGNKFVWNSSCVFKAEVITRRMVKMRYVLGLIVAIGLSVSSSVANTQDSIGTKVKNGKIFILHQVEKSQGLFAISRRYGISLNEIIVANPGSDKILHVNQIIFIPTGKDAVLEEKTVKDYFAEDKEPTQVEDKSANKKTTFAKYHKVASGETLYSISILYNTKVDVIKNLNGLETDILSPGQQVMVPATKDQKDEQDHAMIEAKQELDVASDKLQELKETIKGSKLKDNPVVETSEVKKENYSISIEKIPKYNTEKVSETGVTELLEVAEENTNKRVCSHHNASIGSTIMVTNPANKKSVFVKVVANHTLSEEKGNIIQLSETAQTDIQIVENASVHVSFAR